MLYSKNITIAISFLFLIFSCNNKFSSIIKSGYTTNHFKTVIPFEVKMGLIIIKIDINEKPYHFIFDTGSPTSIISTEIKNSLNLDILTTEKIYDVNNNYNTQEFTKINEFRIGNTSFSDIGVMVFDLNTVSTIKCFEVDGLIGSNLFRYATWYIDYERKEITIASNLNSLDKSIEGFHHIHFFEGFGGVPSINTYLNKQKILNNTIDFGYGGEVMLDKKMIKKVGNDKISQGHGISSIGLYGSEDIIPTISYKGIVNLFSLNNTIDLKNQTVIFSGQDNNTIGTGIFKYYHVILDWNNKEILLKRNHILKKEKKDFGYSIHRNNGTVYISSLYENSKAKANGLRINDKIISINTIDLEEISEDKWCKYLLDKNENDTLHLLIERENVRKEIILN